MTVPAAKVKEICTAQEAALVRSSRSPALGKLTPAEVKKNAARARKLYDKWLALSRGQSRAKSKKTGFGESKANTSLKLEILGDALKSFENKLSKLESVTGTKKKAKTKKARSAGHRAARAEIRAELALEKETLKKTPSKPAGKKATKKKSVKEKAKKVSQNKPVTNLASSTPPTGQKAKKTAKKNSAASKAKTAAKKARIKRSGLDSRVLGHVSARGKRAQARRDSKG
jgi:hypothetical protein